VAAVEDFKGNCRRCDALATYTLQDLQAPCYRNKQQALTYDLKELGRTLTASFVPFHAS